MPNIFFYLWFVDFWHLQDVLQVPKQFFAKFFLFIYRAFALLPDKSEKTYKRFWEALNTIGDFKPESVRIDFEFANTKAIEATYGEDTEVWYCLFHLNQNCQRKICEKHKQRYQTDKEFATRCRMVPALAFLPPDEVIEAFEELVKFDKEHPSLPNLLPTEYVTYFEKNYIGKVVRRNTRITPR